MPNGATIDTSGLLTIMGLIAAVWAVVPAATRLRFRLSVTWIDWTIVIGVFLTIHYLVFEPVFRALGLYRCVGPWKWGLDTGSAVYLLALTLGFVILFRARAPKLPRRNIALFIRLADNLLLSRRYDELVALVEPQFARLIKIVEHRPWSAIIVSKVALRPAFDPEIILARIQNRSMNRKPLSLIRRFRQSLVHLEDYLVSRDSSAGLAQEFLKDLCNSPSLAAHIAKANPGFGLQILRRPETVREDFLELFMDALLSDSSSRLYAELKNNQNLNGRHRLALPSSNRILVFLFKDVSVAAQLGLYRAVGEAVCRRLDEDQKLIDACNRSFGYFDEVGKFHNPAYAGIKLFEIMVHEGIHQGLQDHLWLFYFTHFTDGILNSLRPYEGNDENYEFPSPFHYLLYQVVSITGNWVEDCIEVDVDAISPEVRRRPDFDPCYISEQAANALGTIIQSIIQSSKLGDRFNRYMLETVLTKYRRIKGNARGAEVATKLVKALIHGPDLPTKLQYRQELSRIYGGLDHVLRADLPEFSNELDESLN